MCRGVNIINEQNIKHRSDLILKRIDINKQWPWKLIPLDIDVENFITSASIVSIRRLVIKFECKIVSVKVHQPFNLYMQYCIVHVEVSISNSFKLLVI